MFDTLQQVPVAPPSVIDMMVVAEPANEIDLSDINTQDLPEVATAARPEPHN